MTSGPGRWLYKEQRRTRGSQCYARGLRSTWRHTWGCAVMSWGRGTCGTRRAVSPGLLGEVLLEDSHLNPQRVLSFLFHPHHQAPNSAPGSPALHPVSLPPPSSSLKLRQRVTRLLLRAIGRTHFLSFNKEREGGSAREVSRDRIGKGRGSNRWAPKTVQRPGHLRAVRTVRDASTPLRSGAHGAWLRYQNLEGEETSLL